MRAARWTSPPTYPSPVKTGVPVWTPIRTRTGPGSRSSASLRGGGECVVRCPKDVEERVALGVDLGAAVPRERLAQDAPVLSEHSRVAVAELVEQPRRSLYVCEEERQPAVRQLGHGTVRP